MVFRFTLLIGVCLAASILQPQTPSNADSKTSLAWSRQPPLGLTPQQVPQFVAITFDDNFGSAFDGATGGMKGIVDFYRDKRTPDGTPIKASFYFTSIYLIDDARKVMGGKPGEDHRGLNRQAWSAAVQAGHEAGDHTVNHFNGGVVPLDPDDCCRARNFTAEQWADEINACRTALSGNEGIGVKAQDVVGFRAPYLGYNDLLFTALDKLKFAYDTSLPNCFANDEDGTNCSWPYTLDVGSPDIEVIDRKFSNPAAAIPIRFPKITKHPGLWEIPPTTLVIPPDDLSTRYGFTRGLRQRISRKGVMPYPSLYEASTGKIAGLDYTLLIDAGLTGAEMSAVLKYNLDLHLQGNRSPLVFVAHSHLYSFSSAEQNPDTPTAADRDARWKGLTDFIQYALSKPEVRIVAARDILQWIQEAQQ
jgi:peptidoglycan/xylan/chitin deacetylase (PgdA/CDA1 family)